MTRFSFFLVLSTFLIPSLALGQVDRSLAVLPLEAREPVSAAGAEFLTETVVVELRRTAAWSRVITPRDLVNNLSMAEQTQLVKCAQNECTLVDVEIAGALGVTHMLVGSVAKLGSSYVLTMKLLDLKTGLAASSVTRRVKGTSEDVLADDLPTAVDELMLGLGVKVKAREVERRSPVPMVALGVGAAAIVLGIAVGLSGFLPLATGLAGSGWAFSDVSAFEPVATTVFGRTQTRVFAKLFGPMAVGITMWGGTLIVALVLCALGLAGLGAGAGALVAG